MPPPAGPVARFDDVVAVPAVDGSPVLSVSSEWRWCAACRVPRRGQTRRQDRSDGRRHRSCEKPANCHPVHRLPEIARRVMIPSVTCKNPVGGNPVFDVGGDGRVVSREHLQHVAVSDMAHDLCQSERANLPRVTLISVTTWLGHTSVSDRSGTFSSWIPTRPPSRRGGPSTANV